MIARIHHFSHLSIVTKLLIQKELKRSMLPETVACYRKVTAKAFGLHFEEHRIKVKGILI